jgi:hypothetical protein
MNSLTSPAKTFFATLAMLPLLAGNASAQETTPPALDPEIPWFKVEVIVFRNLHEIPDDEVFTPAPRAIILGQAREDQTGAIDARALGQAGNSGGDLESGDTMPGQSEEATVPAFGDTLDSPERDEDSDEYPEQDLEQSGDDSIVPGSHFRLIAIENLFPDPEQSEADPGSSSEDTKSDPKAGLSREEAADYALMNELELSEEGRRIGKSSNYALLAHMAWIQPGYAREDAIAFPFAELAGAASGLHGDLTLQLSRYLHLQFNLAIDEQPKTPAEESTAPLEAIISFPGSWSSSETQPVVPEYRIIEKRRMRSGELHYIDHPRFGVLTRISKVKPELLQPDLE